MLNRLRKWLLGDQFILQQQEFHKQHKMQLDNLLDVLNKFLSKPKPKTKTAPSKLKSGQPVEKIRPTTKDSKKKQDGSHGYVSSYGKKKAK